MNRYAQLFSRLDKANQGAFVPFVMLGDPTPELSLAIVDALVEGGADALELGIPFSDPVADGPTIQGAALRAFASHTTPDDCFGLLARIRAKYPQLPIGLLVYANLVYVRHIDGFYEKCQQAGVDSVLVADVPVQMCTPYKAAACFWWPRPIRPTLPLPIGICPHRRRFLGSWSPAKMTPG